MNSFLTHIPQTGQGTGSQLSARHGGRGLGEEEGLYIFLTPNQFHACAGLLPLLRPCTGPKVVEPASRECGHHRKDEGGAHELTGNAMYPECFMNAVFLSYSSCTPACRSQSWSFLAGKPVSG